MKRSNISIFVPHLGCPHMCSFCDQRAISGHSRQPDENDIVKAVETAVNSGGLDRAVSEIAFFGGSFTAIDREYMIRLLKAASEQVQKHGLLGIRISTRPDAIDSEILTILKRYNVTSIELGAQSMDDEVLRLNLRGHSSQAIIDASHLIKQAGFSLGLQMMTGLYGSDDQKDRKTAAALAELLPDTMRIYPTVVMKNTYLAELYLNGSYKPNELDECVELCAWLLDFFEEKNIDVIRLGLHSEESMTQNRLCGCYHPAFRELCESKRYLDRAVKSLKNNNIDCGAVEIYVNDRAISQMIGQKKSNIAALRSLGYEPVIKGDNSLKTHCVKTASMGNTSHARERKFF